jgi:hypothetical protein
VQQLINSKHTYPCRQTQKIDAEDFQPTLFLKTILSHREHSQDSSRSEETEDHKRACDGGVSYRESKITFIRKRGVNTEARFRY